MKGSFGNQDLLGGSVTDPPGYRQLTIGAFLNVAGYLGHSAGHLHRGLQYTPSAVFWSGLVVGILAIVAVVMSVRRDPMAPQFAIALGVFNVLAFAAVHFPPYWGPFSEPWRSGVDPFSWITLGAALLGSFSLGFAGVHAFSRRPKTAV